MRAVRTRALRTEDRPHPGRKHGGGGAPTVVGKPANGGKRKLISRAENIPAPYNLWRILEPDDVTTVTVEHHDGTLHVYTKVV